MCELCMPSDLQYKDELRKQRDEWETVLEHITNDETAKAQQKIERILRRIKETLED